MTERFINILTEVTDVHAVAANIYKRVWRRLNEAGDTIEVIDASTSSLPRYRHNDHIQRILIPETTIQRLKLDPDAELQKLREVKMPGQQAPIGEKGRFYLKKALMRY